jgi:hypothetical protein
VPNSGTNNSVILRGMDNKVKSSRNAYNFPYLCMFNFIIPTFEDRKFVPKSGDIWILIAMRYEKHFVKFCIPRMEKMFGLGEITIRVKHVRVIFRLMNWKLNVKNYWVLENKKMWNLLCFKIIFF